jgi:leucyl aminopeptidase
MIDQQPGCIADQSASAKPLYVTRPAGLAALLESLSPSQAAWLRGTGFAAKAGDVAILPDGEGVAGAAIGLGRDQSPFPFGALPFGLPENSTWQLQPGDYDPASAVLGFCLGAYRYTAFKSPAREPARLVRPTDCADALAQAAAVWMVRDLINAPANLLGPAELAGAAAELARRHGAEAQTIQGDALDREYPTVAAVGRGSARAPAVAKFRWCGSRAHDEAPLIALCGKGVCFDTGGYDLKPSSGMLRMKKDMGGAANILGLARLIMEADLPVRLMVRVGCVENSVSGTAMRPMDILRTRSGLTVEVGNTDAEGRLVLCDLLAEACEDRPALVIDFATLTGAARVALGPDLPALFCNDEGWAEALRRGGQTAQDPAWRLPLWQGYDSWLKSEAADLSNVSSKPMAGAVTAALFLQRFITQDVPWAHVDMYCWNDQTRPGRPEGGEAQALRGIFAALQERFRA